MKKQQAKTVALSQKKAPEKGDTPERFGGTHGVVRVAVLRTNGKGEGNIQMRNEQ
jgi:hypothetical protein